MVINVTDEITLKLEAASSSETLEPNIVLY